jgi:hypothetical protein
VIALVGLRSARRGALVAALAGAWSCSLLAALSCGSRSALDGVLYISLVGLDSGDDGAGLDSGDDGALGDDADASMDAEDARPDRAADASPPPIDAHPLPDVVVTNCGANTTYIYVVTKQDELLSFNPPTATFTSIGTLACPSTGHPFSMAVDRQGVAYVLYDDGLLFRVSTRTARCTATSFGPTMFRTFGMGFVGNPNGASETLYISPSTGRVLGTIDVQTFQVNLLGNFTLPNAELTGTGDGRLFAFYATGGSSAIAQVDPSNAVLVGNSNLVNLPQGTGWAFGFWGGDFYLFTTPSLSVPTPSLVTRFRPSNGSQTQVATLPSTIVGAGVSTCAPQM